MEQKPFESIVGKYFECKDDPPQPDSGCPALSMHMGGISLNTDTGEWICPRCYLVVGQDADNDDQMFDDDEDDGEAFEEVTQFVAEGADKLFVTFTDEQQATVARLTRIEQAIFKLGNINNKFATYLENNQYYIVKELRAKEISGEPAFQIKLLMPKIIAIAIHRSKLPLSDAHMRLLPVNPNSVRTILKTLESLEENSATNPLLEKMYYVGNSIGITTTVISIMFEQYEIAGSPPNIVPDITTRAAAWIYLKAKQSKIKKVTKAKLKAVPGVKKNALDRAIQSYDQFLANGNKPVEVVIDSDD